MTETNTWQVNTDAAEVYEREFVPALFGEWASRLCDAAEIGPSQNVLDVACGTGIVAREVAKRGAAVTGVDINPGMLAVARRVAPGLRFEQANAGDLSILDESYDKVLCQFALMYFTDRQGALQEMTRVTKPGGSVCLAVWAGLDTSPGYQLLAEIAERATTKEAAGVLRSPFVLGNTNDLAATLDSAGLTFSIDTQVGEVRFPSVEDLVAAEVKGSPLYELLGDSGYQALLQEARRGLAPFCGVEGIQFPIAAHIAICEPKVRRQIRSL